MVTWARGGSRPRLGRRTLQFPTDEQIPPGANFYGRYIFNSSVTRPFLPFYLLVSKSKCSNKGVEFVFVKDESAITLKNRFTHHPHGLPGSEEAEPHNALAPSHTSSLAQLVTGQCVILAVLPTDGPRNGCSHKGLVPAVAVGHGAPLAPKRPSWAIAWSECHKSHTVLPGVDAWVTGEKLPKPELNFRCELACKGVRRRQRQKMGASEIVTEWWSETFTMHFHSSFVF